VNPDIDHWRALEARQVYEQKLDAIAALEASTNVLRSQTQHLSGAEAMGATLGVSGVWGAAIGALLILLIDMFMVGAAYVAHRYPKGVT
jgi:hypothetical protein